MRGRRWALNDPDLASLGLAIDAEVPSPGFNEVLIKASAVSLNYRDQLVLEGALASDLQYPFTPCTDLAGTVVAVGGGTSRFKVGDRVMSTYVPGWIDGRPLGSARRPNGETLGGPLQGVLADYVVLHEQVLVKAPESLTPEEIATLPIAGVTAWYALVELGRLRAGQTVVVQGTGGVSLFGLQIALAHGAKVIVTSSDDKKLARVRDLGATHTINRNAMDWVEGVLAITDGMGAHHILDIAGGESIGRSTRAAAPGGQVNAIGVIEGFNVSSPVVPLLLKQITIRGVFVGPRRVAEDFVKAVDTLALKPVIDAVYPMEDFPLALAHLKRGPFGKVVVKL